MKKLLLILKLVSVTTLALSQGITVQVGGELTTTNLAYNSDYLGGKAPAYYVDTFTDQRIFGKKVFLDSLILNVVSVDSSFTFLGSRFDTAGLAGTANPVWVFNGANWVIEPKAGGTSSNAASLGHQPPAYYLNTSTVINADSLGGQLPSYYAVADSLNSYVLKTGDTMTGNLDFGATDTLGINGQVLRIYSGLGGARINTT